MSSPWPAASSPPSSSTTCATSTLQLRETKKKLAAAVKALGTAVTEIFGAVPFMAGTVIGDVSLR